MGTLCPRRGHFHPAIDPKYAVSSRGGLLLAILQFLRRMSETVETQPVATRALQLELAELGLSELPADTMVYEIVGPMFFGAVENCKRPLLEMRPYPRTLIIRLDRVPFMDITGLQTLDEVIGKLRKRGVTVLLCEANARVHTKLQNAGVLRDGADYCDSLKNALLRAGDQTHRPSPSGQRAPVRSPHTRRSRGPT
jgi:SulP family sulfate permease